MKWINEKTVQGDPMDIKKYCIPKEEYNIPLVNEGIQEGRKLVFCKDCRFWGTEQDGYCAAIDDPYMLETEADDFCSWGEKR